ncbi:hypothetical protein DRZ77_00820 [Candidatus Woesearchaeota archaeon]|nr:MAG: hypothetical protein DRZ77_00820 [Candidatus Woesearchaeota archaeon]
MYWFDILELMEKNKKRWLTAKELELLFKQKFNKTPTLQNFLKTISKLVKNKRIQKRILGYRRYIYCLGCNDKNA